jgi:hypothetical protein
VTAAWVRAATVTVARARAAMGKGLAWGCEEAVRSGDEASYVPQFDLIKNHREPKPYQVPRSPSSRIERTATSIAWKPSSRIEWTGEKQ